jgi:polyphosphate kinase
MKDIEKTATADDLEVVSPGGGASGGPQMFNREISWLEFNRRVLEEAADESLPILERVKFLSIFSTNLDEFFMIRVSGIKEQIEEGVLELSPDGMTASEQLREISKRLRPMLKKQTALLRDSVMPALARESISIEPYENLTAKEKKKLDKYFREHLFPILTPQSVDSSHPFPYISNLSVNLGLFIEPNRNITQKNLRHLFRQKRFARIKLPPTLPRLIPLSEKQGRFVLMEEVVAANAQELFPGMKTGGGHLFRVTRDADIELREDEAGDLLRTLERELQRRRFRFPVRLEVAADMPEKMVKLLASGIGLSDQDVYRIEGFLNMPDLMQLYTLERPNLQEKPIPVVHPSALLEKKSIFDVLKKQDVLLHHPFTSFGAVIDFVAQAAEDPEVQAIKVCLYRTGKDSPIVEALMRAAQLGKQVTALVELKARFDEENNIEWARRLESEGVHVVYGVSTLKTHSKLMLVVRQEKGKLVRYVHISSGNYNPVTAKMYTDVGLLTSDTDIGADASSLFNFLTGYAQPTRFTRLIAAPLNMRERLSELIDREITNRLEGREAAITIKINSLTDEHFIQQLYDASQAGVHVELLVRGICTLRPGVKGMSSNITVRSLVGRFLEHSRIYHFKNGGDDDVYIGSADLMLRNLDRRVEILVPVLDTEIKAYLTGTVLGNYLKDNVKTRELRADGTYKRLGGGHSFDAQASFVGQEMLY